MADTPPRNLPPKKEVALALLEGDSVFIHLDPRKEGVVVPRTHGKQPQLVLQIGLHLAIRIPDLTIDDDGVSCTLSFNRAPFWCRLPWGAIYALVGPDGRGMLWPEDVPPEVAAQMRAGRATKTREPSPKRPRPRLAAVSDTDEADPRASGAPPPDARPVARLVVPEKAKRPAARPALAPVPSPGAARPRAPLGAHRPPSERGVPAGTGSSGGSSSRPGEAKRPKRELPPYLRVVK